SCADGHPGSSRASSTPHDCRSINIWASAPIYSIARDDGSRGRKMLAGIFLYRQVFRMQTRWIISVLLFLFSISSRPARAADLSAASATTPPGERLASDTPRATPDGATFVAPGGWWIEALGNAIILSPEGDSHLGLVDVHTNDADAAVKIAWAAVEPNMKWSLKLA